MQAISGRVPRSAAKWHNQVAGFVAVAAQMSIAASMDMKATAAAITAMSCRM